MLEVCSLSMSVSCCFQTQWVTGRIIKTPTRQMKRVNMIKTSINTCALSLIVLYSHLSQYWKLFTGETSSFQFGPVNIYYVSVGISANVLYGANVQNT